MDLKVSQTPRRPIRKSPEEQIGDLKIKVALLISTIKLQLEKMISNFLPNDSLFTIKRSMFTRLDVLKNQLVFIQEFLEDPYSEENI